MTIIEMIPLLERRLKEMRTYELPRDDSFYTTLIQDYKKQQATQPSNSRNRPIYRPRKNQIVCSDMCLRASDSHNCLGSKLGISLPEDYVQLSSHFSEYIIAGRNPIRILDVEEICDDDGFRAAWDVPKIAARRLLYFARVVGEPAHFAFRWNETGSKMDIVYSWDYGDVGEPILLGRDADRFVSDQTFTGWLQRMIETDAHPLFPGNKIPTSSGWMEQDRKPLVQVA